MASSKIENIFARYDQMKSEKQLWNDHYQLLGEFIMTRKQQFTTVLHPGEFLSREIFDNTAQTSNNTMASTLLGLLWPNSSKSFKIKRPTTIPDNDNTKKYYEFATSQMAKFMDNSKAGLVTSLSEYMLDQGVFGTSGIGIFEGDDMETPVYYTAWDVKTMHIDENARGFVDTIYNEEERTVRQAAQEYGRENLSAALREKLDNNKGNEKIKILHVIEPREDADPTKSGNRNMPFISIHIEIKTKKILRERGFEEMPVAVTRFIKAMREKYGRSPGMFALPWIIELNAVREAVTIAAEKQLDPPLAVLDDGRLGGGDIDTSAGAINVFNVSGRITNEKPIFPLFTVGEFRSVQDLIANLTEVITQSFFIDRLLDLNNETEMTAFETSVRNRIRGDALKALFVRQEVELFNPLIERTFNILLKKGLLGVKEGSPEEAELIANGITPEYIPEEVVEAMEQGRNVYDINYITPAKRMMQSEEVQAIFTNFEFLTGASGLMPELLDNIDPDEVERTLADLLGVPTRIIRSLDATKKLRAARATMAQQQQAVETAKAGTEIGMNITQAQATKAGTGAIKKK